MDNTETKIQSQTNRTDRCEILVPNNRSSTCKYLSNYGTPEHEQRKKQLTNNQENRNTFDLMLQDGAQSKPTLDPPGLRLQHKRGQ